MTAKNPSNPLVTKVIRIPFDNIRPEHVEPAVEQLLQEAEKRLASLASSSKDRTYCNTLTALEGITHDLGYAMGIVGHLEGVATEPNLRSAYNAVQPKVSAFYSSIALNEKIWGQIKSFSL